MAKVATDFIGDRKVNIGTIEIVKPDLRRVKKALSAVMERLAALDELVEEDYSEDATREYKDVIEEIESAASDAINLVGAELLARKGFVEVNKVEDWYGELGELIEDIEKDGHITRIDGERYLAALCEIREAMHSDIVWETE